MRIGAGLPRMYLPGATLWLLPTLLMEIATSQVRRPWLELVVMPSAR